MNFYAIDSPSSQKLHSHFFSDIFVWIDVVLDGLSENELRFVGSSHFRKL